jgi:hypothetical protein
MTSHAGSCASSAKPAATPIACDGNRAACSREQQRLVADPARIIARPDDDRRVVAAVASVAAAHDARMESALRERRDERRHERRLARSTDGDVADDHDGNGSATLRRTPPR